MYSCIPFYYANVTGLRSKTAGLFARSADSFFDVISLTETWLCAGFSDAELFGPEYLVFRRDRHASILSAPVGGGVLCAVRRDIGCRIVDCFDGGALEALCLMLSLPHVSVYVVVVYIPPGSSPDVYEQLSSFIDGLTEVMRSSDELLVFGDLNLPSVLWEDSCDCDGLRPSFSATPNYVFSFIDSMTSSGLTQSCGVANGFGRHLDLVFTSNPSSTLVKRCLVPLVPESSHHPALEVIFFHDPVISTSVSSINYCYNFKKADFSRVNEWLSSCDWSVVLNARDIDEAVELFYYTLFICFAQCVPFSSSRGSQSCQPWFNPSLKHLKNLKSKAWKRFCASRSDADYFTYTSLRNQLISNLEIAYNDYVYRMGLSLRCNPKQFWRLVNSKRGSDGFPVALGLGDDESCDPQVIANYFADFFRSSFLKHNCDISPRNFANMKMFPSASLERKDLIFDEDTILGHISRLALNFSNGPDGIPEALLKTCGSSLVSVLCYLFNLSITCGVFPDSWKYSVIIPLHKKGSKCEISNYRPVANLSCIAKTFEAVVCDVLYFHCKPFLGSFQHGFMKGKSTTTNLLEFSNYCITAIESGNQVDCIYTDFSKAFDRIDHNVLIYKISVLGFPPVFVKWLSSYLYNRTQRVCFRGVLSDVINNTSGVPQGSHLGPLLFIIYINDVFAFLKNSRILCYADDAKIFRVVSSQQDCTLLDSDLDNFSKWCVFNNLPLNIDKCFIMSFNRRKYPLLFDYSINGYTLSRQDKIRDLGVVLNNQFSFEDHINIIVNRANATLGFVKRWSKEFDDPYITRVLYCAFVRPILEYASPVWSPFYGVHVDRVEAVQRRFVRFALRNLPWNNSLILPPYVDRLKLLSLETLESRRNNAKILFAFDCLQGSVNSPELLGAFSISAPTRSLRAQDFFKVSHHRTNYGMHEPISSMSRLFNNRFSVIDFNLSKSCLKSQLR